MHTSVFFKLFPPPQFMMMKYAGLDISDDAIHCLQYVRKGGKLRISKYATAAVAPGIINGGDIKDEQRFVALLNEFDRNHHLSYVKVSLPEEKAYLFETDVPSSNMIDIAANIEFKLEENVPLAARDAVFYFDLLPMSVTGGTLRASVSVVPRTYIEHHIKLLREAGIFPIAFEVVPKAMARAVVPSDMKQTFMIVHIMNKKTGIYIVSGGVVCFTSTLGWGSRVAVGSAPSDAAALAKEINRVHTYWMSHSAGGTLAGLILAGHDAPLYETVLHPTASEIGLEISVADIWQNIFDLNHYLPPIPRNESLDYAVAAGLALDA